MSWYKHILYLLLSFNIIHVTAIPIAPVAAVPITPTKEYIHSLLITPEIQKLSTGDKIAYFSRIFIDGPHAARVEWGPLGEGSYCDYNCKPMYRFDAFDCTTFVEMMLALATTKISKNANATIRQFEKQVIEIRYSTPQDISYLTRNHFPETDWIPHNTRLGGLLMDATHAIGVTPVLTPPALIDKKNWYAHKTLSDICVWDAVCSAPQDIQQEKLSELQKAGQLMPNETATLFYVPIEKLVDAQARSLSYIPNGAIVQFIRPNWDVNGITHMHVAHQGIVVQDAEGTWLHHASSAQGKMVRVSLRTYLEHYRQCNEEKMTPEGCVKGINVLRAVN